MPKSNLEKIVWLPRSFSILFSLFLLVLTAEPFIGRPNQYDKFYVKAIVCGLMLAFIAITWNKPKITGVFFISLAIGFFAFFLMEKVDDPTAYSLMSGVPAIIGILFMTFGKNKTKAKQAKATEVKDSAPPATPQTQVETAEPEAKPE